MGAFSKTFGLVHNSAGLNYQPIIDKINAITGVTDLTYPSAASTLNVQYGGDAGTDVLVMLNQLSGILKGLTNYTSIISALNAIAVSVGGIGLHESDLAAWTEIEILIAPSLLYDGNSVSYDALLPASATTDRLCISNLKDTFSTSGKELVQSASRTYQPLKTSYGVYFDGVYAYLKSGDFNMPQPLDIYLIINVKVWVLYRQFLAGKTVSEPFITTRNVTPNIWLNAGTALENTHLPLNQFCILRCHLAGANSTVQIDGTTVVTGNAGTYGFTAIALGASYVNSVQSNVEVRKLLFRTNGTDSAGTKTAIYNHLVKLKNYNPNGDDIVVFRTKNIKIYKERTQGIKRYTLVFVNGTYRVGWITDTTTYVYSSDGGVTYTESAPNADWGPMASLYYYVTTKGTAIIMDCKKNKVWRSTNRGVSWTQIIVKDKYGADMTFHTPANALYPGNYFAPYYEIDEKTYDDDSTLAAWGVYGNADYYGQGAGPISCFYTKDDFVSIKQYYTFGQHLTHKDNGTIYGGITGTILGDATNPLVCRHVHIIKYNQYDDSWYIFTGDGDKNICLKYNYDKIADAWTTATIFNSTLANQQIVDIYFDADGYAYFGIDNPRTAIYKVLLSEINDVTKYICLKDISAAATPDLFYTIKKKGNLIIAFSFAFGYIPETNNIYVSTDNGVTWTVSNIFTPMGTTGAVANKEDSNNVAMLKNGYFIKLL